MTQAALRSIVLCSVFTLGACSGDSTQAHDHEGPAQAPTNRIDVPEAVRQNLGITFAKVERRHVAATRRLNGSFELLPHGKSDVRAPLTGRITAKVALLQDVKPGDVVFTIESPDWRVLQRQLGEIEAKLAVTTTNLQSMTPMLAACEKHEASQIGRAHV